MTGFKRMMAVTDFSKGAARAVERAARLAAAQGAELELLHVMDREPLQSLIRLVPGLKTRPEAELAAEAQARLRELADGIAKSAQIRVSAHVCVGTPFAEIAARVGTVKPDLLVIGLHGEHGGGGFSGATAQKAARAVRVPVLLVRHDARRRYQNVLVPVDLSPDSHRPVQVALGIVPDASLYVLHAYEPEFEQKAYFADASKEALARYRKSVEAGLREHLDEILGRVALGEAVPTRLVRRGYAPHVIEKAAEELDIDLIVMNARDEAQAAKFFLGSVSVHIMSEAATDLLLVR